MKLLEFKSDRYLGLRTEKSVYHIFVAVKRILGNSPPYRNHPLETKCKC